MARLHGAVASEDTCVFPLHLLVSSLTVAMAHDLTDFCIPVATMTNFQRMVMKSNSEVLKSKRLNLDRPNFQNDHYVSMIMAVYFVFMHFLNISLESPVLFTSITRSAAIFSMTCAILRTSYFMFCDFEEMYNP